MQAKGENALETDRGHAFDLCALQIFAQKHAEIGRDEGVFLLLFRKINAAVGRICVEQQFNRAFSGVYNNGNFFARGLIDLIDAPARERPMQFVRVESERESVLRHGESSPVCPR